MSEEMTPRPEDPYGISKYAVELDLAAANDIFGLDYTIFRPHNVYGERQNISDPYRNVIGIFMSCVVKGEPMPIFGDGRQTRAFSHIDDVAPLIARAPLVEASRNQVINAGADKPYSILELAETVARAFGAECNVIHLPPRREVVHAFSSHEKARRIFGDSPTIELDEGIARMARWVQSVGVRPAVAFQGDIEVAINMPPSWATLTGAG